MSDTVTGDVTVAGRALVDGRPTRVVVRVRGGRVAKVARRGEADVDFGDRLLLPGFLDTHVHFRDPGHPQKEDFQSGSTAAAFGGVTTVLDMPNTSPPVTTPEAFEAKMAIARRKSVVDFGLFAGLSDDASFAFLDRAVGLKVYLGSTTGDLLVRDLDLVGRALAAARRAGRTVAFHAESEACMERHAGALAPGDFESHYWSRPNVCEREAIEAVAALPEAATARWHVCHLSTAEGLTVLPAHATAEVAPHHLLLTKDALAKGGAYKMNPPLRTRADAHALRLALAEGRVHLASDHAPHTPDEKAEDVAHCPSGVPGVETMAPLLLAAAFRGEFPLARVVDALTAMPARAYGLATKGALAPGMDADLVVVDPSRAEPVVASRLHSRAGWTPYEGLPAVFPDEVWLRGRPIVRDGRLLARPGQGEPVRATREALYAPGSS